MIEFDRVHVSIYNLRGKPLVATLDVLTQATLIMPPGERPTERVLLIHPDDLRALIEKGDSDAASE